MSNSIEKYIQMRIEEIRQELINLQIHYPDTYAQALVNWHRSTRTHQKENLDR